MSNLIISNRIITTPIIEILHKVQSELKNGKLSDIIDKGENVVCSCPRHKNGQEKHASCTVYADPNGNRTQYGFAHCFTCGYAATLPKFIGDCFNRNEDFGEKWLLGEYGDTIFSGGISEQLGEPLTLESLNKPSIKEKNKPLDESTLAQYDFYHPYTDKRHISREIVNKFRIGFDKVRQAITFPVYDENNNLVMVTARSVWNKTFYIPEGVEKPVYLLNYILQNNIREVLVCEGQIDALVAWSYGMPAIALFGAGTTPHQMEVISNTNIQHFILAYDNDKAGRHGSENFRKMLKSPAFVTNIIMPFGKDVADCTQEEFYDILQKYQVNLKKALTKPF